MKKIKFVDQLPPNSRRQYRVWCALKAEIPVSTPMDIWEWEALESKMLKIAVIEHDFQVKLGIDIHQLKR